MTADFWPQPTAWGLGISRDSSCAAFGWSLKLGPLELHRWGGPPVYRTPEERARLRGMVIACVALTIAAAALVAAMWSTT